MKVTNTERLLDRQAADADPAVGARAHVTIEASQGWASLQLGRLWQYRELLYFLIWRDVKVRYKQTLLGILWIVLQPLISITIFTLLFGRLLSVPSGDAPYPVFLYAALLPWSYFANALNRATNSLVGNAHLITKVYFPRLIIPISGVLSAGAASGAPANSCQRFGVSETAACSLRPLR